MYILGVDLYVYCIIYLQAKTEKELKMEDTAIVAATQALIPGQPEIKVLANYQRLYMSNCSL